MFWHDPCILFIRLWRRVIRSDGITHACTPGRCIQQFELMQQLANFLSSQSITCIVNAFPYITKISSPGIPKNLYLLQLHCCCSSISPPPSTIYNTSESKHAYIT